MKKLRLDAEAVEVESFVVSLASELRGTVRAKEDTLLYCHSFAATCWNTGCTSGITAMEYCPTANEQTCNGWPGCTGTGDDTGWTADQTCSDYGCTVCVAWC